jgi:hypothetical protein
MWVIRSINPAEVVSCWDAPEKVGHLAKTNDGKKEVMLGMFTPIKVLQAVLEGLGPVVSELMTAKNGTVSQQSEDEGPQRRGPTLLITAPEEERAIFRDESDPPVNSLIKGLKGLSVEGKATTKADAGDAPTIATTVATKNDKARVHREKWDKMLYFGLPKQVRTRSWAWACRTIRPLVARHRRRLQLRKWIKCVREKRKNLEEISELDSDAARDCLLRLQASYCVLGMQVRFLTCVLELPGQPASNHAGRDSSLDQREGEALGGSSKIAWRPGWHPQGC